MYESGSKSNAFSFIFIRNKKHNQTHCTSRYSYTSQVHIPTPQHSHHLPQWQCSNHKWGHVSQLIFMKLAANATNSPQQCPPLHHHHNVCPLVCLLLAERYRWLRVLNQVVMKKRKLQQRTGRISSQLSFTKLGYMPSFAGGTLPPKEMLTMLRSRDVHLRCTAIPRCTICLSVFPIPYILKLHYFLTHPRIYRFIF